MHGKGRPKFARRGKFTVAYTDEKTVSAENWIKTCAVDQAGNPCLEGPLIVTMDVSLTIPDSWSKKKKVAALSGELRPTGKPDVDNYFKTAGDALNEIVWRDDSQIVEARVTKRYAEIPQTIITVEQIGVAP